MNDGDTFSDSEIVQRAKEDPQAFGLLYERFVDRIYNYIYYRVGNHHDAEDLTSRTFQRALANYTRFEERGAPVSAWFYRIAHNLVANWHRDRSRRQVISLDDLVTEHTNDESPTTAVVKEENRQALLRAIRNLPEDRQQLLLLKFNECLPNDQIGKIMGKSESAIKSLYHRTLLSLRDELHEQGFSAESGEE